MAREGGQTRARILGAATRVFARAGSAATLRELAAAAGLDNSSLYRHFRSKEELERAALAAAAGACLAHLAPLDRDEPPRLETLVACAVALGDHLAREPDHARLLVHWLARAPLRGARAGDADEDPPLRLLLTLAAWLRRARASGAIRRVHVSDATVALAGALLVRPATAGLLVPERPGGTPVARRARAREVAALVRGALRPSPDAIPLRGG